MKKRQIAKAKAKAENRKKALKMLQNAVDKKDDDDGDEDMESGFRKEKPEEYDDEDALGDDDIGDLEATSAENIKQVKSANISDKKLVIDKSSTEMSAEELKRR